MINDVKIFSYTTDTAGDLRRSTTPYHSTPSNVSPQEVEDLDLFNSSRQTSTRSTPVSTPVSTARRSNLKLGADGDYSPCDPPDDPVEREQPVCAHKGKSIRSKLQMIRRDVEIHGSINAAKKHGVDHKTLIRLLMKRKPFKAAALPFKKRKLDPDPFDFPPCDPDDPDSDDDLTDVPDPDDDLPDVPEPDDDLTDVPDPDDDPPDVPDSDDDPPDVPDSAHKGKRINSYTIARKLDAIDDAERLGSNRLAAKKHNVDRHSLIRWRQQQHELMAAFQTPKGGNMKRLTGSLTRALIPELEDKLMEWIKDMRKVKKIAVTSQRGRLEAMDIYRKFKATKAWPEFTASKGWWQNFKRRHRLSNRRGTHVASKDPKDLLSKIVDHFMRIRDLKRIHGLQPKDLLCMDETAIWFDMPSNTTIDFTGAKDINLRTTPAEKRRVSVCLTASGDGTKYRPFIVFQGAKRVVEALQDHPDIMGKCIIASTKNGWMTDDTTLQYVNQVIPTRAGKQTSNRVMCWDTFQCHSSVPVKNSVNLEI